MHMLAAESTHYLFVADFDQALSFNDAGPVLAGLLGVDNYAERIRILKAAKLVQAGGELPYLLERDADFQQVRREQLVEAGRRIRLKHAMPQFMRLIGGGIRGLQAKLRVVSAAPKELVVAALERVVPDDSIIATELEFDAATGALVGVRNVPGGSGRVAALDSLAASLGVPRDRMVYIGDGAADVDAMTHVNSHYGFTVGVSQLPEQVAQHTVISDNACSLLIPVLEQVLGWRRPSIRSVLEKSGLRVDAWQKTRMDTVRLAEAGPTEPTFA
jgi:phosphoserine phosphatase